MDHDYVGFVHMEEVAQAAEHDIDPDQVARIQLPFGLEREDVAAVDSMLLRYPDLQASAQSLLGAPLAKSTMSTYSGAINRFKRFCAIHGYNYKQPTEEVLVHYLTVLNQENVTNSILDQVRPALTILFQLQQGQDGPFTPLVNRMLQGAKRQAALSREPVQKAKEVGLELVKAMVAKHVTPFKDRIGEADIYMLRTTVRIVIIYFTFCRLADYVLLQSRHVERKGRDLQLCFSGSKNDQLHRGQYTMLKANDGDFCPVKVLKLYGRRLNLSFGRAQGETTHLHCKIRKLAGRWYADRNGPASESLAREELAKLLVNMGMDPVGITHKSFKCLGVTATMATGVDVLDVAAQGRWDTLLMPLRYRHNSDAYKKQVAGHVPT